MRTTKPITVSLPADLVRETQRVAREESRTRSDLIRDALQQYLTSRRWRRLRQWGAETADRPRAQDRGRSPAPALTSFCPQPSRKN